MAMTVLSAFILVNYLILPIFVGGFVVWSRWGRIEDYGWDWKSKEAVFMTSILKPKELKKAAEGTRFIKIWPDIAIIIVGDRCSSKLDWKNNMETMDKLQSEKNANINIGGISD